LAASTSTNSSKPTVSRSYIEARQSAASSESPHVDPLGEMQLHKAPSIKLRKQFLMSHVESSASPIKPEPTHPKRFIVSKSDDDSDGNNSATSPRAKAVNPGSRLAAIMNKLADAGMPPCHCPRSRSFSMLNISSNRC